MMTSRMPGGSQSHRNDPVLDLVKESMGDECTPHPNGTGDSLSRMGSIGRAVRRFDEGGSSIADASSPTVPEGDRKVQRANIHPQLIFPSLLRVTA